MTERKKIDIYTFLLQEISLPTENQAAGRRVMSIFSEKIFGSSFLGPKMTEH